MIGRKSVKAKWVAEFTYNFKRKRSSQSVIKMYWCCKKHRSWQGWKFQKQWSWPSLQRFLQLQISQEKEISVYSIHHNKFLWLTTKPTTTKVQKPFRRWNDIRLFVLETESDIKGQQQGSHSLYCLANFLLVIYNFMLY